MAATTITVPFQYAASNAFVGPLPANANETVVLTTPLMNIPAGSILGIYWMFSYTPGTSNTSAKFNIRQGATASGALVNNGTLQGPVTAAVNALFSGMYYDTLAPANGIQYSLTIQQIAATGAGTFLDGCLIIEVMQRTATLS